MSVYLFTALLNLCFFLIVVCALCGDVCAGSGMQISNTNEENAILEFFKPENTEIDVFETGGKTKTKIPVKTIGSVFLVANNDFMVALTDVSDGGPKNEKINLLTKYVETKEEDDWGKEAIQSSNGDKWNLQLAVKELQKTKTEVVIKSLAVAAKEDKIFLIMASNDTCTSCKPSEPPLTITKAWHVTLVEGKVTNEGDADSDQKKTMVWTDSKFYVSYKDNKLKELLKTQPENYLPSNGFVFVADNKKYIIFVIKNKQTTSSNDNNITAVFQLEEKEGEGKQTLLPVDGTAGCYPSFFQWKGELFKTPTDEPKECREKMMVFSTKGNNFTECNGSIARLRDFLKDKKSFTTAFIEGKNVLLFTQQKNLNAGKNNVYLWMTDGTCVGFVGTIVENIADPFYGSVLYTKKELFALHPKYENQPAAKKDDNKFTLKRLESHLQNITDTLKAWEKNEKSVLALCQNDNEESRLCIAPPPRAALVGFLHNTTNEDTDIIIWKDEYYFSNATIKQGKGEKVTNGFKFSGKESGAKWPVSNSNNDQPYNFTDPGFTLVATIKIDQNDKQFDNSLFGVTLSGETKRVGLLCTRRGKWAVSYVKNQNEIISSETDCKQEVTYNVALMLGDQKVSVYVDGKKLNWEENKEISIKYTDTITSFYFGVDTAEAGNDAAENHVTVTSVLLYNRPFFLEEIKNLKEYVKPVEVTTRPKEKTGTQGDQQQPTSLQPRPTGEEEKKEAPSPSRTEDGGVRVFFLLLAVLCVSAPLLHL